MAEYHEIFLSLRWALNELYYLGGVVLWSQSLSLDRIEDSARTLVVFDIDGSKEPLNVKKHAWYTYSYHINITGDHSK